MAAGALAAQARGRVFVLCCAGTALLCSVLLCLRTLLVYRSDANFISLAGAALFGAGTAAIGAALVLSTATNRGAFLGRAYLASVGGLLAPGALLVAGAVSYFYLSDMYLLSLMGTAALALLLPGGVLLSRRASFLHPFSLSAEAVHDPPPGQVPISAAVKAGTHRVTGGLFDDWPEAAPFAAEALYAYTRAAPSELSFRRGDRLVVLDCRGNWWQARHGDSGLVGFVPSNYVRVLRHGAVLPGPDGGGFVARHPDEVSVRPGDVLEVMEAHEHMSLVRTAAGRIGSVPTSLLDLSSSS